MSKLAKKIRDAEIKKTYETMDEDVRSMRKVAKMYEVSRTTVLYAINGRPEKK